MIAQGHKVIAIQEKRPARRRTWVVVCLVAEPGPEWLRGGEAQARPLRWARETKLLGGLEVSFHSEHDAGLTAERISYGTGVPVDLRVKEGALCNREETAP